MVSVLSWLLALVAVGFEICVMVGGAVVAAGGAPFPGWVIAVLGFVVVIAELVASFVLTFFITAVVSTVLWVLICRPTACRVSQDFEWAVRWAFEVSLWVTGFCNLFFYPLSLHILDDILNGSAGYFGIYAQIRRALGIPVCGVLDPNSFPWLRP